MMGWLSSTTPVAESLTGWSRTIRSLCAQHIGSNSSWTIAPMLHAQSRMFTTSRTSDMSQPASDTTPVFLQTLLFTDSDGRARFREQAIALDQGKPAARLSAPLPARELQLRESPPGFRSEFHCTGEPQWVFILSGQMEIGLQDGSSRIFSAGEHFYSADVLPAGAVFDPAVHGHWSRQLGNEPLRTLFVRG